MNVYCLDEVAIDLSTLSVALVGTSCLFGTIIYSIERMTNPESTVLFPNIGNSVYYTLLAITNVAFEGFLPSTYAGKWIACAAITIGLLSSMIKEINKQNRFDNFLNISCYAITINFIVVYWKINY